MNRTVTHAMALISTREEDGTTVRVFGCPYDGPDGSPCGRLIELRGAKLVVLEAGHPDASHFGSAGPGRSRAQVIVEQGPDAPAGA